MARRARTRERRAGARIESPAQAGERSPDGTAATRPRPSISQQPDAERSLVATAERVLGVSEATSREPEHRLRREGHALTTTLVRELRRHVG